MRPSRLIPPSGVELETRPVRLTPADVPRYLLERELVCSRTLVEGDLAVRDFSSRRNHVLSAECRDGRSYLLKQSLHPGGVPGQREGDVYDELSSVPAMQPYLPEFHGYDTERQVLVLELIPGGGDLASYHRGRRRCPPLVGSAIGTVLAELHNIAIDHSRLTAIESRPSPLSLRRPNLRFVRDMSPACQDLVRIIQHTEGYRFHLDELDRSWSATALIHHDVRLKNFVLATPVRRMRRSDLKLIDWELACLGDPRWDIGSALASYLSLWLSSIPITGMADWNHSAQLARYPLGWVQPAIHSCWSTYVRRRGLEAAADHLLSGTVGFAAARLVQTAFESAHGSIRLTASDRLHLQVALNMLERPQEAIASLLGLPTASQHGAGGPRRHR